MEMDLKKAFYMIIAVVLLGLIATNIAQPVYTKISAQKAKIESVNFTGTP